MVKTLILPSRRSAVLVSLLAILLAPAAASGQIGQRILNRILGPQDEQPATPQPPSWVGKRVMTVRPGVYGRHSDEFGRQVRDADLTDLVYTVLNQEDDFLWIRHRSIESWVPRTDVVLLDEGVSFFSERIRRDPNDSYAFALRGRAWREEGELERALKDLNTAVRLDPKNATWLANRGMVHDELDESSRALDDYDDAIKLEPREAQHYLGRALVHKHDKHFDDAIDDYTAALRLEPKSVDAYYNRGNAYKAKRNYEEAIRDYTEAIRLDPEAPDAYFNRANARKAKRDYKGAVADLRAVVRLDPKDADALGSLAWLLATCPDEKFRDGKKAVDYATKACELTSWKAPYFLATLAAAQAEAGEFTLALKWQEKALDSPRYERDEGDEARDRLKLFKDRKAYRED
jgi:tetratricopeptide (TPR) repeat protein